MSSSTFFPTTIIRSAEFVDDDHDTASAAVRRGGSGLRPALQRVGISGSVIGCPASIGLAHLAGCSRRGCARPAPT
jgi:hypothetical protein